MAALLQQYEPVDSPVPVIFASHVVAIRPLQRSTGAKTPRSNNATQHGVLDVSKKNRTVKMSAAAAVEKYGILR